MRTLNDKSLWVERKRAQNSDLVLETSTPVPQVLSHSPYLGALAVCSNFKVCAHGTKKGSLIMVMSLICMEISCIFCILLPTLVLSVL